MRTKTKYYFDELQAGEPEITAEMFNNPDCRESFAEIESLFPDGQWQAKWIRPVHNSSLLIAANVYYYTDNDNNCAIAVLSDGKIPQWTWEA